MRIISLLFFLSFNVFADLKFDSNLLDLTDQNGKQLKGVFTFVNNSPKPLKIKDLKSTCGCINAKTDKLTYSPQERGIITLTMPNPKFTLRKHVRVIAVTDGGEKETVLAVIVKRKTPVSKPANNLKLQTFCPYMGLKIKPQFKYEFKNTVIFTCCKACLEAVKKDPEQAIRNLSLIGQRPMTAIEASSLDL